MSFLGGAECSTAGNPLSQFTKHVQDDKSLQRDRLVGRGSGAGLQGIRSTGINGSQDAMMNDFLQQGSQMPQAQADPFFMESMRPNRMGAPPQMHRAQSPQDIRERLELNEAVKKLQQAKAPSPFSAGDYQDFIEQQKMNKASPARATSPITSMPGPNYSAYQNQMMNPMSMGMGMGYGMGGYGMNMGMMSPPPTFQDSMNVHQQQSDKGKGKMVELDDEHWEEQFKQMEIMDQEQEQEQNDAIERELNELDRSVLESETNYGDFESIWRGIQAETAASRDMVSDEAMISEGGHLGEFDSWGDFDSLGPNTAFRDPQLGDYLFESDNIFQDVPNAFEEGMRIMHEGGNLSLAALAFEAAVQKDPSHLQAWVQLGAAQAQNEKETPAIRALEQALKLDPSSLDALMGLAVSYTNEGYDSTAYRTLERWLSVKYPSIADPAYLSEPTDVGFTDRNKLHEKVTDLFIRAAQLAPDAESMDPDVQVGLGVLFYGAEEYDKAVDCFSAALASSEHGTSNDRATVHLLWNRLGATLANSGRSEEAIAAYERALSLKPNFVRARYNLGVSCINIGCYEEAAAHLLGALAMHRVTELEGRQKAKDILGGPSGGPGQVSEAELDRIINQNQSTNLYDTLRRVFSQMNRRDLADVVGPGMDVEGFRGEFEF